jgi:hypothetical protein
MATDEATEFPERLNAGWKAIENDDLRSAEEIARRAGAAGIGSATASSLSAGSRRPSRSCSAKSGNTRT